MTLLLRSARIVPLLCSWTQPAAARALSHTHTNTAAASALAVQTCRRLQSTTAAPPAEQPAYTIQDAPVTVSPDAGSAGGAGTHAQSQKRGWYMMRGIPGHTKKLNPYARQVTGKSVPEALAQMKFGASRRCKYVHDAIQRACWNADVYHDAPAHELMVESVCVGAHIASPRMRHHSKGRTGLAHWRTSRLRVVVRGMTPEESSKLVKWPRAPSEDTRARVVAAPAVSADGRRKPSGY